MIFLQGIETIHALWRDADTAQRSLMRAGVILLASGLLHVGVYLADGGAWGGPVSWRKPILFGLSTGITLVSMGWVLGHLKRAAYDGLLGRVIGVSALIEVGLITLQAWRGTPSHFNTTTPTNAVIEYAITFFTTILALGILVIVGRVFYQLSPKPSRDGRLAIQAGGLFLVFSILFGFWMVYYGHVQAANGQNPAIYGEGGVLKFVHGIAIHAIQFFPLLGWFLSRRGYSMNARYALVLASVIGMALLTLYSLIQTFSGLPRFDFTMFTAILLAAGVAFSVLPILVGCLPRSVGAYLQNALPKNV